MKMKVRQDGIGREDTISLCGPRVIHTGVTPERRDLAIVWRCQLWEERKTAGAKARINFFWLEEKNTTLGSWSVRVLGLKRWMELGMSKNKEGMIFKVFRIEGFGLHPAHTAEWRGLSLRGTAMMAVSWIFF